MACVCKVFDKSSPTSQKDGVVLLESQLEQKAKLIVEEYMLVDSEPDFQHSFFCTQLFYTQTSVMQYDLKKASKSFANGACGFLIFLVATSIIIMQVKMLHFYAIYKPYTHNMWRTL